MATTHHPAPTHVGFGHHHEWLWITIGAIVVGIVAAGISWAVLRPTSDTVTLPSSASGFEYDHEVTPIQIRTAAVTSPFVGESGDLHAVVAPVRGFDVDHESTAAHLPPDVPVTGQYFGNSGVLFPEVMTTGLVDDHDATTMHLPPDEPVTSPFVGSSG